MGAMCVTCGGMGRKDDGPRFSASGKSGGKEPAPAVMSADAMAKIVRERLAPGDADAKRSANLTWQGKYKEACEAKGLTPLLNYQSWSTDRLMAEVGKVKGVPVLAAI